MGKKNRNKGKKKPVALSFGKFSKQYGISVFKDDNTLPTGPSVTMDSSHKNEEYWRGSNVSSNPMEKSKADEDNNWRRSSNVPKLLLVNNEKQNSVIVSNTSKFSFQNIENKNAFVPSRRSKFVLRSGENPSTSKFSFQNLENKSMFVPSCVKKVSNRFNLETVPTVPTVPTSFRRASDSSDSSDSS